VTPQQISSKSATQRLQSLDVLRGLTVAVMIMVNTSGDAAHTYPLLAHSRWNGCTLADVVFPCFLFMVGISCVFSISGRLKQGSTKAAIVRKAAQRTVIIFLLGLAVNSFPFFLLPTLRIFGVLQRIALCYFAVTLLTLFGRTRTLVALFFSILVGYWILLRWAPVPGLGTPGSEIPFLDPHANLAAWLDRHLLSANHLYHRGFYDPEGLLSTIPSVASSVLGALAGIWVRTVKPINTRARGLAVAGLICLLTGLIWSHWFPLNKRLWTSSFVLWTGGISLLVLWLLFWLIDQRQAAPRWATYPAVVFGTNALTAYIFSEFLATLIGIIHLPSGISLHRWLYQPLAIAIPNPSLAALAYAVLFVGVCFLPAVLLYRKRIFIKI
jgi:predicted acyltransferase